MHTPIAISLSSSPAVYLCCFLGFTIPVYRKRMTRRSRPSERGVRETARIEQWLRELTWIHLCRGRRAGLADSAEGDRWWRWAKSTKQLGWAGKPSVDSSSCAANERHPTGSEPVRRSGLRDLAGSRKSRGGKTREMCSHEDRREDVQTLAIPRRAGSSVGWPCDGDRSLSGVRLLSVLSAGVVSPGDRSRSGCGIRCYL
ncbi:hypothetical protein GGS23DRAFT_365670 [Durotheca rogersii]|uniref:uncharacterized protein n=1 Tax=Durotheca rogersii TaxID=419775 RepID=UPI00221E3CA9|nr:uncharacterized protein GGS23DRAFT_365670 [Durotheca rogersii]KAI5866038.1 hypothetical protein GGS23DRAFT_365670 [Durotheca rogersii]